MNASDPNDDLFESLRREHGLLPPGEYPGELVVAVPFTTPKTSGQQATIKITEGPFVDKLLKLRFVLEGPSSVDYIIAGNAEVLALWWNEVGAQGKPSRRAGFDDLFKKLWQHGRGRRLIFTIDVRTSDRFSENILTRVEWMEDIF